MSGPGAMLSMKAANKNVKKAAFSGMGVSPSVLAQKMPASISPMKNNSNFLA
jgi:hypothetical protein